MTVRFTLNGRPVSISTAPHRRLLDVLREELNLTGTKEGCGIGECGACTVLVNGKAVNSCLVLIGQVEGAAIVTIEGLADGANLRPLQRNFMRTGAVQCGFCTPGVLLAAHALLSENPQPTEEQVAAAIAGNLCRCTGYKQIIEAVMLTAQERSAE
jgi:carbon-monoxide dehydrogenase small subunit